MATRTRVVPTGQPVYTQDSPEADVYFGFCTGLAFLAAIAAAIVGGLFLHEVLELRETGIQFGKNGTDGLPGSAGITEYASYWHAGSQAAPIAAGQPLTLETLIVKTSGISSAIGIIAPFVASGSVFTLPGAGTYSISYHAYHVADGAFSLFAGPPGALVDVVDAHAGGNTATDQSDITILLVTPVAGWQVAVVCATGSGACTTGPNAGTTVASAQSIVIEKIA